jgi:hypothetical protein
MIKPRGWRLPRSLSSRPGGASPDVSGGLAYYLPRPESRRPGGRPDLVPLAALAQSRAARARLFLQASVSCVLQFAVGAAVWSGARVVAPAVPRCCRARRLALAAFPRDAGCTRSYVDWPAALLVTAAAVRDGAPPDAGRLRLFLFGGAVATGSRSARPR